MNRMKIVKFQYPFLQAQKFKPEYKNHFLITNNSAINKIRHDNQKNKLLTGVFTIYKQNLE